MIGIDLGTTNSAVAWTGTLRQDSGQARGAIRIFDILQLVAPGETDRRPTLPSFLYFPQEGQRDSGLMRLPWNPAPDAVAGVFARDEGALVPARQVASAKSWLSNPHVDRTAPLLPWGVDADIRISPADAATRVLAHIRDAWNHERAGSADERLERHAIVLTVPASFDEEARELTVQAARDAGFANLTLLEEPLAALYAWIGSHRRTLASTFGSGALILVCDVGGGTTDFSLIRAALDADGELEFERIAIGEHLLLGGDNLDLALAALVEQKLPGASKLSLTQRQALRRKCSAAKEQLLAEPAIDRLPVTILGAGRGLVGGGMTSELTREEVVRALSEGFLPITPPGDLQALRLSDRRIGLRELGLPYETEPAITRHLAAFLTRAGSGVLVRPDAVLFNGGFFAPPLARERVLDALAFWFGERPATLENRNPEAAVAIGAAFYGRLRRDPIASKRLIIRAGSARSYYVGVEGATANETMAVAVMPRGTAEGTTLPLEREFTVMTNQPAAFTLLSSIDRTDPAGALVSFTDRDAVERHAPLVTVFRFGKRSRRVPLRVRLTTTFTETGTLELWCESTSTDHRWRLAFNLRGTDANQSGDTEPGDEEPGAGEAVIAEAAVSAAAGLIRDVFESPASSLAPDALVGELETTLGHGKLAWPLAIIRQLADVLLEVRDGRSRSAAHEARWLNLAGFCVRPGFGSATDAWRVSELRKVYAAGLAFPKDVQNQVEWIVLWQRASAGFSGGQQRELALRMQGLLGLGQKKAARLNPQIEREAWRLLASLERLDAGHRAKLGDELMERIRRAPRNSSWLWAIGRLGSRTPFYGPLNSVVLPAIAERWIDQLLQVRDVTPETADAIVQIGARTGDAARDLSSEVIELAAARIEPVAGAAAIEPLRIVVNAENRDRARVFGEALPEGLRLA